MRKISFILVPVLMLVLTHNCLAQADSVVPEQIDSIIPARDSVLPPPPAPSQSIDPPVPVIDTVSKRPGADSNWKVLSLLSNPALMEAEIYKRHPWLGFSTRPEVFETELRQFQGKEIYFYVIVGLLLLFAILRNSFAKYFNDLFRVFFRTTLKQRQIREQLIQTPLPSLLLNIFFMISAGIYLALVLEYYDKNALGNVWQLAAWSTAGIAVAYIVKFIGLKILGTIFGIHQAVNSYIFVVFIINKMVGILLLPFIVLLAFAAPGLQEVALKLSFLVLIILLIYRFILTFAAIRNQVKVNPFHFLLYVIAFEVAPLILVYKALLTYFPEMA